MKNFFNSRRWTPKDGNICREKRHNRTSNSTLMKVSLKRRRQRLIDLTQEMIRELKRSGL